MLEGKINIRIPLRTNPIPDLHNKSCKIKLMSSLDTLKESPINSRTNGVINILSLWIESPMKNGKVFIFHPRMIMIKATMSTELIGSRRSAKPSSFNFENLDLCVTLAARLERRL